MNARVPFYSMDQVELQRGLEAEIRSALDRLKPDTRRGAEMLLEGMGFSEEDYNGPLCDWADAQYNRMSESEQEDAGWRAWDDEAYGARLPRLGRMRRMLCAGLAVALLALTGCGPVRVLNEGAAGPWRVSTSTAAQATLDAGSPCGGFCDHWNKEIRIAFDLGRPFLVAVAMHELGHKIEREYPRIWVELDAMDTPEFPCGSDDLHAARRAAAEAQP